MLLGGEAALFVERGGRTLVPLREPDEEWLRPAIAALVEHVRTRRRPKRLAVERFDGQPVIETEIMPLLVEAVSSPARAEPSCARKSGRRAARSPGSDSDLRAAPRPAPVRPACRPKRMLVAARAAAAICFVVQGTLALAAAAAGR